MRTSYQRPDFFIIGAPRCGTTAMSSYLGEHPDICFAQPKEPLYFCDDMPGLQSVTDEDHYLSSCFAHCAATGAQTLGEGSVWYLYSDTAVPNILSFNPNARFIIMLRNPLEMLASLHRKLLTYADENQTDFAQAWGLQKARARGERLPPQCREPRLLQYGAIGSFGSQVQRAFELIPPAQRMVIIFDDFLADPRSIYEQVLAFLGVPSDGRVEFPQINENARVRNQYLLEKAWAPPSGLMRLVRAAKSLTGIKRLAVLPRLRNALTVSESRPPMEDSLRQAIIQHLEQDNALLSRILQRDLTHWLN